MRPRQSWERGMAKWRHGRLADRQPGLKGDAEPLGGDPEPGDSATLLPEERPLANDALLTPLG